MFKHVFWIALVGLLQPTDLLAQQRPPNIVMIISDDQTYTDFGFMGNARVQTPNLDSLARKSARYTHGYVPSSVCRPSLVTLLTGLYPHQHGIHFNHPTRLLDADEVARSSQTGVRSAPTKSCLADPRPADASAAVGGQRLSLSANRQVLGRTLEERGIHRGDDDR